jgi:ribosomal protein S18 acetylase RimI-like enzyme
MGELKFRGLSLVRLPPDEWPALAGLIHACNRRPDGVHCLHAAHGADVASHAAELAALPSGEAAFWVVMEQGQRVGVVGCEFDPALRRAWLRGPLVTEPRLLDALLPAVCPTLERALPEITQFDGFPAADGTALNGWYGAAGFEALQLHRVLRAPIREAPAHPRHVRPATPPDLPAVSALHDALFPGAYLGAADFARAIDGGGSALFVASGDGAAAVGYLHVQDDAAEREAYVDYLGVDAAHRGHGLGQALLDAAFAWGAGNGRAHIALTVREDRRSALDLYLRAGFVEISAGRHWRKEVSRAGAGRPPSPT